MLRIIRNISTVLALVAFNMTCYANNEKELGLLFKLECPGISNISVNKKGDVVWNQYVDGENQLFYLSRDICEPVNITENISNLLLEMGYKPTSWKVIGECKPWECKYFLNYMLNLAFSGSGESSGEAGLNDNGDVLIRFSHEGHKRPKSGWKYKLGVWNKNHGFKVLSIPGLDDVAHVILNGDYLYAYGNNQSGSAQVFSVVSIGEGFWD